MQPEAIVIVVGISIVAICMGGLIGSVLLRAATNWVVGIQVDATTAFFCVAFSYLPRFISCFAVIAARVSKDMQEQVSLLLVPLEFFLLTAIIWWSLRFRILTSLKITAMIYLFGFMLFLLLWAVITIFVIALQG